MPTKQRSKNDDRIVIVMPGKLKRWLQFQSFCHDVPISAIVIRALESQKQTIEKTPPAKRG